MKKARPGESLVYVRSGGVSLEGALSVPDGAAGIVLFAHGSGSSRKSPRNNFVARVLRDNNLGTLLMDLLTAEEDMDYERRFDIDLLAKRLTDATLWLSKERLTADLRVGYFGASTGAAAAIKAAIGLSDAIGAIVSRGGRPDLANEELPFVKAPTLLIVGERDESVIEMNRRALMLLTCEKELTIVPRATHLFEEPGALDEVALLAARWFVRFLRTDAYAENRL